VVLKKELFLYMKPNPFKIYEEFNQGNMDKSSLINLMISLIEGDNDEAFNSEAFKVLHKISSTDKTLFQFLENIIISDEREGLRCEALKYMNIHFIKDAFNIFKWAIKQENSYNCLIIIFQSLAKLNSDNTRKILFENIKSIRKTKFINKEKGLENIKYRRGLKSLFKSKKIQSLSQKQLSEILINYYTINYLIDTFPNVFFEIDDFCLIKELDLSDYLEYEVKGTPWGWKNNIDSLSRINCLENLLKLEKLNLSNNKIKDLKDLVKLNSLIYLDLSNNKISEKENITYLKQLPNLKFIDLRGNQVANLINKSEFSNKIRILRENSLENLEQRLLTRFGI
jgi:hypothetical protein